MNKLIVMTGIVALIGVGSLTIGANAARPADALVPHVSLYGFVQPPSVQLYDWRDSSGGDNSYNGWRNGNSGNGRDDQGNRDRDDQRNRDRDDQRNRARDDQRNRDRDDQRNRDRDDRNRHAKHHRSWFSF